MELVKLSDVCKFQYGFAFDSKMFSEAYGVPLIRIRDIVRGYSETYTTEKCRDEYIIDDGDILVGMDGEFNVAKWRGGKAYLNQRVCKIIPNDKIDPNYLYYYLPVALKNISVKTSFVTVKHLSAKELNKMLIPFPSKQKQQKISSTLDKIQKILYKQRKQLELLDKLTKSRFMEMFVNSKSSNEWKQKKIKEISLKMRTGPFGSALHHDEFVNSGVFVLGIDNAVENKFSYNKLRYITEEKYEQLKKYTVKPYDVIITIMGTIGRSAVVPGNIPKAINTKHLACITVNQNRINPYFLALAFQIHPSIQQQIKKQTKGAIMKGLNLTIIKNLSFDVPPIERQNEFIVFYHHIDKSRQIIQASLDETQKLFDSLMQQYFG